MSRLLGWIAVFGATLLVACSPQPPSNVSEYCKKTLRNSATILIVDRTTSWNTESKKRFDDGVENFLSSRDALGEMSFAELRSSAATLTVDRVNICLLPI